MTEQTLCLLPQKGRHSLLARWGMSLRGYWNGWRMFALLAAACVLLPIGLIFWAYTKPQPEIWQHLADTILPALARNTALLVTGTLTGTFILGTGLAWLTAVCRFPGRKFLSWALLLPMAIPTYVLAFVALGLFEFSGPIQTFLRTWSPAGIDRLPDIRSAPGVIVVMSLALYPYVYLLARSAFRTQGRRSIEAARSLGIGPFGAFFRVVLPMARPWIVAGLSMVLMETLADFGAVSIFNFDTFTTAIYKTWYGFFSLEAAAQLSGLLVMIVFCVLAVEQWLRARMRFTSAGRLDGPVAAVYLSGWRKWAAAMCAWSVFSVAFAVPLAQLLIWSIPVLEEALDERFVGYVGNTLGLSAVATLLIVGIAVLLTYVRRRHDDRLTWFLARSATLGYALPGTVLAVGVVMVIATLDNAIIGWVRQWTGAVLNPILQGSVATVVFAYAVRFMAAGLNPVESAIQRITPSLDEAAATMGVTGWRLLGRVHLPMLKSGVFTAAVLVCVDVMKEMPITLMTRPFGWDTLSVKIFEYTSEGEWQLAALPAVVLVVVGLAPIILLTRRS